MSPSDNDDDDEDEDIHEMLKCAISLRFNGARLKLNTK